MVIPLLLFLEQEQKSFLLFSSEIREDSENTLPEEIIRLLREGILLLQIDFDDHIQRDWGDSGRQYFWIRLENLLQRNFDRVHFTLQCY